MEPWMTYLSTYLVLINLYGYLIMGLDKRRAKKGAWRISEKHLLAAALFGGSLGVLMGMKTFRHKTQHRLFTWSVPAFLLLHLALLGYLFTRSFAGLLA